MIIKAYRNTMATDISSYVLSVSPFSMGLNWNFTMELPQTKITTLLEDFVPGEKIILVDAADSTKQITFVVRSVKRNYEDDVLELDCPHVLYTLSDITPAFDLFFPLYGSSWGDLSDYPPMGDEGYQFYNNQMAAYAYQGQYVWERSYVQILYLIKALIHLASGASVQNINDSDVATKDSFYYDSYSSYGQTYTTYYKYSEIAVSVNSINHLGYKSHDQNLITDLFARQALPTCLDLLRLLCQTLFITIDLCRSDYKMDLFTSGYAPTASLTITKTDESIERMKRLAIRTTGLPQPGFIYGEWDTGGTYIPYTFGVQNPDYELETRTESLDTEAETTRTISVTWPNHFRPYAIESGGPGYLYRSKIKLIQDIARTPNKTDHHMWLNKFVELWEGIAAVKEFGTILPGITSKLPRCTIDIENDTLKYDTWSAS